MAVIWNLDGVLTLLPKDQTVVTAPFDGRVGEYPLKEPRPGDREREVVRLWGSVLKDAQLRFINSWGSVGEEELLRLGLTPWQIEKLRSMQGKPFGSVAFKCPIGHLVTDLVKLGEPVAEGSVLFKHGTPLLSLLVHREVAAYIDPGDPIQARPVNVANGNMSLSGKVHDLTPLVGGDHRLVYCSFERRLPFALHSAFRVDIAAARLPAEVTYDVWNGLRLANEAALRPPESRTHSIFAGTSRDPALDTPERRRARREDHRQTILRGLEETPPKLPELEPPTFVPFKSLIRPKRDRGRGAGQSPEAQKQAPEHWLRFNEAEWDISKIALVPAQMRSVNPFLETRARVEVSRTSNADIDAMRSGEPGTRVAGSQREGEGALSSGATSFERDALQLVLRVRASDVRHLVSPRAMVTIFVPEVVQGLGRYGEQKFVGNWCMGTASTDDERELFLPLPAYVPRLAVGRTIWVRVRDAVDRQAVWALPRKSVAKLDDGRFVALKEVSPGVLSVSVIKVGAQDETYIEVMQGVAAGDLFAFDIAKALISQKHAAGHVRERESARQYLKSRGKG